MNGNTGVSRREGKSVLSTKEYEYFVIAVRTFLKEIMERFNIDVDTAIWNIEQEFKFCNNDKGKEAEGKEQEEQEKDRRIISCKELIDGYVIHMDDV